MTVVNSTLGQIQKWCCVNLFQINTEKKFLRIGNDKDLCTVREYNITINVSNAMPSMLLKLFPLN